MAACVICGIEFSRPGGFTTCSDTCRAELIRLARKRRRTKDIATKRNLRAKKSAAHAIVKQMLAGQPPREQAPQLLVRFVSTRVAQRYDVVHIKAWQCSRPVFSITPSFWSVESKAGYDIGTGDITTTRIPIWTVTFPEMVPSHNRRGPRYSPIPLGIRNRASNRKSKPPRKQPDPAARAAYIKAYWAIPQNKQRRIERVRERKASDPNYREKQARWKPANRVGLNETRRTLDQERTAALNALIEIGLA